MKTKPKPSAEVVAKIDLLATSLLLKRSMLLHAQLLDLDSPQSGEIKCLIASWQADVHKSISPAGD